MNRLSTALDNLLYDTDAHAERLAGVLTLTRASLLLPYANPLFSHKVYAFVSLVPQWAQGALALAIGAVTLHFAGRHDALLARIWCAYTMGAYWLALAILFLMGEVWVTWGWLCLAMCLAPLSVIVRLHTRRRLGASFTPKG